MRPDLQTFGRAAAVAPNLDSFAKKSGTIVFGKAYANYPMCSPSRTSTLFGRNPLETGVLTNVDPFLPGINPSLPKFLQSQGYYTAFGGKIFHSKGSDKSGGDNPWNNTYKAQVEQTSKWCSSDPGATPMKYPGTRTIVSPMICLSKSPLGAFHDFQVAAGAIKTLKSIVDNKKFPFFLAAGFYKPHLPLHVKTKFVQMNPYTVNDAERPLSPIPRSAYPYPNLSYSQEGAIYFGLQKSRLDFTMFGQTSQSFRLAVRKAYASGVTQTDAAVGLILEALEMYGLSSSTMVVFMSDHGYGLGENNLWAKDSLYDISLRVPLMIHIPWLAPSNSNEDVVRITSSYFELVDLYRTVTSILGLPSPDPRVEGKDQSGLIQSSIVNEMDTGINPSTVAFANIARCRSNYSPCIQGETKVAALGYSVRNDQYRYTVFMKSNEERYVIWEKQNILSEELYDHSDDHSTIFNYAQSSYAVEYENIAPLSPVICNQFYEQIKARFKDSMTTLRR